MEPQTALLIAVSAAIVGPIVGALLTLIGGFINDYFTRLREERQEEREYRRLKEQREYEKDIRKEQQAREEEERLYEDRLRVYQAFLEVSAISEPVPETAKGSQALALSKSYMEVQFFASDRVSLEATKLYRAASGAIKGQNFPVDAANLENTRPSFLSSVRSELVRGE